MFWAAVGLQKMERARALMCLQQFEQNCQIIEVDLCKRKRFFRADFDAERSEG